MRLPIGAVPIGRHTIVEMGSLIAFTFQRADGGGEVVFWRFHAKREPHEIMRLRQPFRFFCGDAHVSTATASHAPAAHPVAKIRIEKPTHGNGVGLGLG